MIKLDLTGSLTKILEDIDETESLTKIFEDIDETGIILGFTTNGKKITLLECYKINQNASFPGIFTQIYRANYIFEGEHFLNINDLKFYKVSSRISMLEEWVNIWGFDIKLNSNNELNTNFKIPDDIPFDINENLKGLFAFSYKADVLPNSDYKIQQTTKLELIVKNEANYSEFLQFISHFNLFITLGVFSSVDIKEVEFYSKSITHEHVKGRRVETPIKVYFSQIRTNNKLTTGDVNRFLFTFNTIKNNFEVIIKNWFLLKESISPVLGALSEIFAKRTIYTELKFLHIVQALEVYHRRLKQDTKKLKIKFKEIIDPIRAKVDKPEKKWLNTKLSFGYEPTLRERLEQLFVEFHIHPLSKILISHDEIRALIDKTVNSRNYYTHYSPELKAKACHERDLVYLSEKLKVLLIIVILRETGFQINEIEALFETKGWVYFNHIMNN